MIVTTEKLFAAAYGKYSIGAYNINNLEQIVGLFRGNQQSNAPFTLQRSRGARKYTDKLFLEGMIRSADQVFPDTIFAVHLDHGDEESCHDCIDSGFYSSVMIDASKETFEKNIEITKRVVQHAHEKGICVEAELGQIGGVEEDVEGARGVDEEQLRDVHKYGVVKINIDTDGRLIWTRVHREYFRDDPKGIDFRDPGKTYIQAYADFIAAKNAVFGSANQLEGVRALLKY